jgi:hypothetical protein
MSAPSEVRHFMTQDSRSSSWVSLARSPRSTVTSPISPRISILDHKGQLLGRHGTLHAGIEDGTFVAPHILAMDFHADLCVGEALRLGSRIPRRRSAKTYP